MAKDIDLLAKNAKTYNEPGSQVFKVSFLLLFSLVRVIPYFGANSFYIMTLLS